MTNQPQRVEPTDPEPASSDVPETAVSLTFVHDSGMMLCPNNGRTWVLNYPIVDGLISRIPIVCAHCGCEPAIVHKEEVSTAMQVHRAAPALFDTGSEPCI